MIKLLKRLYFQLSKKRKIQLYFIILFIIVNSLFEVVALGSLLPFLATLTDPDFFFKFQKIDYLSNLFKFNSRNELLYATTIFFVLITILSGTIRLFTLWVQNKFSYSFGRNFSYVTYRNALHQPYSIHIARNTSEIISLVDKSSSIGGNILLPILTIISSSVLFFFIITTLFFLNPNIAIWSIIGFGSFYFIITKLTKKKLKSYGIQISQQLRILIKSVQEGLGGIRDILIDGTQKEYLDIFSASDIQVRKAQANVALIGSSPRFLIETLGLSFIAIFAYILSTKESGFSQVIPTLGVMALGAQRMLPVLQQLFFAWSTINANSASLTEVLDFIDCSKPNSFLMETPKPIIFNSNLIIKDLSFGYDKKTDFVLNSINLTINKGDRVGIVGETGSGKSTLLDILLGLQISNSGQMLIDDINIDEKNIRAWQLNVAHVPQFIYLADKTVLENIAFGVPIVDIDIAKVKLAAKKAQIDYTIDNLDNKYNTIIGERGAKLSGGQRQRLGIARALYKEAKFIIFDEATSALDADTELEVMNAIQQLGKDLTIIIVAHRISTLNICNKIFKIKEGKVTQLENNPY
jgi:ABC-type multidrug transport system fused ATPase/permease subunit